MKNPFRNVDWLCPKLNIDPLTLLWIEYFICIGIIIAVFGFGIPYLITLGGYYTLTGLILWICTMMIFVYMFYKEFLC